MEAIDAGAWRGRVMQARSRMASRLEFMTPDHHRVRRFTVSELPRRGPLIPTDIATALSLPLETVEGIVEDLERRLFFLVRDADGRVNWAFPVTAEPTAHQLTFSTGERISGA